MMQKMKGRQRSGSLKMGKSSGPRIVTNIRTATKQQIITRHNFYMYEFRTKYCQGFPLFMCKQAKPYTCVKAHYENNIRRRPRLVNGKFNFTDKLCAYASITDCPHGMDCPLSHRVQKEHIYHPSLYKTQLCESPLNEDGICVEFGVHCAKAHGVKDLRQPQYEPDDPRAQLNRSGSASPNSASDSSGDAKTGFKIPRQFDENTKELKIHADYMYKFRVERCIPHSLRQCVFDSNTCFHSHSDAQNTRRIPELINGKFNYLPIRCQYMLKGKTCHHGRNCRFAHSKEEVIYHPSKYKTQLCPHRLKKVFVTKDMGYFPDQNAKKEEDTKGKPREMWVCSGYGIHCAKAHGKEDLRLPVFENCSKEIPIKPHSSSPHYRKMMAPDSMIFRPTGMSHGRYNESGGAPVYRSMNNSSSVYSSRKGSPSPLKRSEYFPRSNSWKISSQESSSAPKAIWGGGRSAPKSEHPVPVWRTKSERDRPSSPTQKLSEEGLQFKPTPQFKPSPHRTVGFNTFSNQFMNLRLAGNGSPKIVKADARSAFERSKAAEISNININGNGSRRLAPYLPSFLVNFVKE
mmetsp:Transcript_8118/g.12253  ORF Transcript_8118/g.12253 Transcript_8118/m.12253 type:complete len:573 (+) Transcript_8118:64-1782(+)